MSTTRPGVVIPLKSVSGVEPAKSPFIEGQYSTSHSGNATEDVSALVATSSVVDELDAAVDDILARYRGRYDELASIAGCEKHTVERWGPRGLSRPRTWHIAAMSRHDAKFRAMVGPLFGFDQALTPEEMASFDQLKAAIRASALASAVNTALNTAVQQERKSTACFGGAGEAEAPVSPAKHMGSG